MTATQNMTRGQQIALYGSKTIRTENHWGKSRDSYGRTVHNLDIVHIQDVELPENPWQNWTQRDRHVAVVVSMPKVYREMYPGQNYLVNLRVPGAMGDVGVHYCKTLAVAKSFAQANHGQIV